jgi:hypothetical protein
MSEINNTEIKKERRGRPRTFVFNPEAEPREARKKGRPFVTGTNPEEKKLYASKDPEYLRNYYDQVTGVPLVCEICGTTCTAKHMKRHQESKFCKLAKLKQEVAAFDELSAVNESA